MTADPTDLSGALDWETAQTFLAVAEQGSFSAAAAALGVRQPTISRRIAALEARLGSQLFTRSRQGAALTEQAAPLLPAAREMARWAAEFQRAGAGYEQHLQGVVRIAAPPGVAVDYLPLIAAQVRERYPGITLEIRSAVDYLDLGRGEADLAIRTQVPRDPDLHVLLTAASPIGVYAAPDYLARLAPPCDWSELDWITWSADRRSIPPRPMLERVVENFAPVFCADDFLVQRAAAQAGLGVIITGAPLSGWPAPTTLVPVPMRVVLPPATFVLVCAKSARHVPRIGAVAGLLREAIATQSLQDIGP